MVKFIVELYSENDFDRDILEQLLRKPKPDISVGQQKIQPDEQDSGSGVELATAKQKGLMKRLHIVFDENTSKFEASNLISEKMDKSKEES